MQLWKRLKNTVVPTHENVYRPHMLGRSSLVFFVALTLAVEGFLVASLVARQSDGTFLSAVIASDVIGLTNSQRELASVSSLVENTKLDAAAQAKAEDMAKRGYFSHVGPDGVLPWTWILRAGYAYKYAGENLAVRFTDSSDVVRAWMASPAHRANVMKSAYTEIGVGVAEGMFEGKSATFVVQYFGTEVQGAPAVAPNVSGAGAVGAAAGAHSFMEGLQRQFVRIVNDPAQTVNWVLGTVAVLLFALVMVSFVMHLEVQSTEMLLGGATVAALALLFAMANVHYLPKESQQAAGVIEATDTSDGTFSMNIAQ
jgi:uncharacterized protein YkwD